MSDYKERAAMSARVRIKICGISTIEEALAAVDAGADALGFVFYSKSKRAITPAEAQQIICRLPPFVTVVGLVVNASREHVRSVISAGVDVLQFHGDETPEECASFNVKYIKAVGVDGTTDIELLKRAYGSAQTLLLDVKDEDYGGTGRVFDWSLVPQDIARNVIIAGGLKESNIGALLHQLTPYAIDVSSGVEYTVGGKSTELMQAFCKKVLTLTK